MPALHSSQPTMGRGSVTLSRPSKRSPNHINHRLTLGSSPATPTVLQHRSLMHRMHNRILMEDWCELEPHVCWDKRVRKRMQDHVQTGWHCFYLMLKKGIGFWQKRGFQCTSSLEKITCSPSVADFLNLISLPALYGWHSKRRLWRTRSPEFLEF